MENKITDEQLSTIQEQQNNLSQVINEIGVLETRKHALLHQVAEINTNIEEVKAQLEKEYGAVNINLEDGTYTEITKEEEEVAVSHV